MRVMRVLTRPNVGGPTKQAIALWHEQARLGVRTLLVVGVCEDEPSLDPSRFGVPAASLDAAIARGRDAEGVVVLEQLRQGGGLRAAHGAYRSLRRLCESFAPDVVHTHLAKAGLLGRSAARKAGVPVVAHTYHGHVLRGYFGPLRSLGLRLLERRLARRTDLIVAVSDSCRDELVQLGIVPRERTVVLPPALDLHGVEPHGRSAARRALGIPEGVPVLGWNGRLVPIKRFDLFLEVVRRIPDAEALVAGDGPNRAALAGAPARVRALGAVDAPWRSLAAADVLVMPSAREGFPLAALEALAAGVPVAGFAVPGVEDVLRHVLVGVALPAAFDVEALTALVRRLLCEPALRELAMSRAPALLARSEPARVAALLRECYEGALAASRGRRRG